MRPSATSGNRIRNTAANLRLVHLTSGGVEKFFPFDWLPPAAQLTNSSGVQSEKGGAYGAMAVMMLNELIPMHAAAQRRHTWDRRVAVNLSVRQLQLSEKEARTIMLRGRGTQFDPETVDVFLQAQLKAAPAAGTPAVSVGSAGLVPGMVLARELRSTEGVMLLAAGHVLTADLIKRIRQYEVRDGLTVVLLVRI